MDCSDSLYSCLDLFQCLTTRCWSGYVIFDSKEALVEHYVQEHPLETLPLFACTFCEEQYEDIRSLGLHMSIAATSSAQCPHQVTLALESVNETVQASDVSVDGGTEAETGSDSSGDGCENSAHFAGAASTREISGVDEWYSSDSTSENIAGGLEFSKWKDDWRS